MGLKWVWCGICARYLTFGTYPTSTVGALRTQNASSLNYMIFFHVYYAIELCPFPLPLWVLHKKHTIQYIYLQIIVSFLDQDIHFNTYTYMLMSFMRMIQARGSWSQFSQTQCFYTRLVGFGTQVQVALLGHCLPRQLGEKDFSKKQ